MFMKRTYLSITLLLMLLFVAACGNTKSSDSEKESEDKNAESTEITLQDAMGEVVIPANPERIIAPYLEDSLVALGVKPAAQWSIGETVLDYLQADLSEIPKIGWDMPLEQAINNDPDLIIFSSLLLFKMDNMRSIKKSRLHMCLKTRYLQIGVHNLHKWVKY
jgi:iron complex transport system substrate-binding protein